jgi:dTDP-4-amino-4,6-dideoxygalactose transaminase
MPSKNPGTPNPILPGMEVAANLRMTSRTKSRPGNLAVFGAMPAFADNLHVGRPNVGDRWRLMQRMAEVLDSRWFTNSGPMVQEFERAVEAYTGARHCIAMCNATIALEIAIRATEMKGEVIVPSFTFIATPHALQWQEITPVFCDIDPATHCLDPRRIEEMITPRTTGILGVHVWGNPCDVEAIDEIARRHNLRVLYDAAHAFGCSHGGAMIGNFGEAEVFSFHATKFLNTFEGGAVVTNNDDLARRIRLMKNFGFAGVDDVIYIGTNGKMAEMAAAMGLTSLESIDEFIAVNKANYHLYREEFAGVPGLSVYEYDMSEARNYQYVVVSVDGDRAGLTRDELVQVLQMENVLVRRYFYPGCHQMEPYRSHFPHSGLLLPETERLTRQVMILPTGTAVGEREVRRIGEIVKTALRHAPEVRAALLGKEKAA